MGRGPKGRRAAGRQRLGQAGLPSLSHEALARRLRLVVITDERLVGERGLTYVLEAALRGGAPAVQIRAKDAAAGELYALATRVGPTVRAAG
ncbi:MAG: thiamine phosphate synthase, partial [Gemmatimonadetes bacterium]|nr:thiamine phosphate synthase [Gemmatimonadota bacterium]